MYVPTFEEDRISEMLKSRGILLPWHLSMENMCIVFDIDLEKGLTSVGLKLDNYRMISVNKRKGEKQMQYEFYHELAHVESHNGDQDILPDDIIYSQENQAESIALYCAIPFHMIRFLDLTNPDIIRDASDLFNVPEKIAHMRLMQIRDRLLTDERINFFNH